MNIFNNNIYQFLIFFIPGFVSIKIHDLLIASDNRDFSKSVLEVIAFSAINYALLSWLIWPIFYYKFYEKHPVIFAVLVAFILFIFPVFLPLAYARIINLPWVAKNIVHPIKRPWDWFLIRKNLFGWWLL